MTAASRAAGCWLLAEWPPEADEPTDYWLSNLPADTPTSDLVRLAKIRRRIEHDYRELKTGLGLAPSLVGLAYAKARGAMLHRDLIDVAAWIAREITLDLPERWHREQDWMSLLEAACSTSRGGLTSQSLSPPHTAPCGHKADRQPRSPASTCGQSRSNANRRKAMRATAFKILLRAVP